MMLTLQVITLVVFALLGMRAISVLTRVLKYVRILMATQKELADQVTALGATVAKIGTETSKSLQMITDLQAQVAAAGTADPALVAAVDALAVQLKGVDDLVPDAPVVPPTP